MNVKQGDFITYDKAVDGDWDHIGYVSGTKNHIIPGYWN